MITTASSPVNNLAIPKAWKGFKGYNSDPTNCPGDMLSSPSLNCFIDANGAACQRMGYAVETDIDLGVSGSAATCFYLEQYDVTIFALGTALKYYDWNTRTVYDTGVTLTTGTTTRFDAYTGDIYVTNTTDGLRRLVFGRLNDAAATAGDGTVTIDSDMAARLSVFSLTSGNLRIQGTNEAYASLVVGTGVVTLSGTLSKSYSDNAVCLRVQDISSSREKASKVFFWKERMGLIGSESGSNADQPNATVFYGKFATADTLENIIDFTYGAGGSTRELVGKWGKITNAVPAKDFLYIFKESQSYSCAASEVVLSGSGIGSTVPDLRDENNGCLNEDSACIVGNNEITYITSDRRIMRIRIATESGAAVLFPDETFDIPIREHLKSMDANQAGARAFYHKAKRRSIYQVRIGGQWYWLVYDHNIQAWQPPQQVLFASDFFERKGVLYACDGSDHTVYSVGTTFDDNLQNIYCLIATGNFNVGSAMMKSARLQGQISQAAQIKLQAFVTNKNGGRQGGSEKTIDGSSFSYSDDHGVGADPVGDGGVESITVATADWEREFDIYPSEANKVQLQAKNESGGYFSISQYSLTGKQYPSSLSSSL